MHLLDPALRRTITRLGCALPANCYRGCREGRRVGARASVYKHCDVITSSYNEPQPIPTVIRLRSSHSIRARPSRRPVLRRITLCAFNDTICEPNKIHRHVSNVQTAAEVSDCIRFQYIAIVTETHFKSKHSDAVTNIPGYTLYRRDRAGRRSGGVATYDHSTLQSTAWSPANDDKTFELQWTRVGTRK